MLASSVLQEIKWQASNFLFHLHLLLDQAHIICFSVHAQTRSLIYYKIGQLFLLCNAHVSSGL